MKPKEFNKALRYLTSSATDKVKPKSNAKLVNTSKVQDSKPARARFFVNPVTKNFPNRGKTFLRLRRTEYRQKEVRTINRKSCNQRRDCKFT